MCTLVLAVVLVFIAFETVFDFALCSLCVCVCVTCVQHMCALMNEFLCIR